MSSTIQQTHQATSLGVSGPKSTQLVVDYAIASCITAPWVTGVTVGDALPTLSDHCLLMLGLPLAAPLEPYASAPTTLCTCWELGAQAHLWVYFSSLPFPPFLLEATSHSKPQFKAASIDVLLLATYQEVGLS